MLVSNPSRRRRPCNGPTESLAQAFRAYDTRAISYGRCVFARKQLFSRLRWAGQMRHFSISRYAVRLLRKVKTGSVCSPVERAEGILAATQGRDFAAHFEKSIAIFKRYSLPLDEADTLHDWGVALQQG